MSQILVRDLDPETVEQLKQRARSNRRSLQAEVRVILEEAARWPLTPSRREELVRMADLIRKLNGPQMTSSVDLIREDRER
jgi:plasmid stability protein